MKPFKIVLIMVALALSMSSYANQAQQESAATQAEEVVLIEDESATEEPEVAPQIIHIETKKEKPKTPIGLMVGMYNPLGTDVKYVFGQRWLRLGLRPIRVQSPERWLPTWDLSYYAMSHQDDRATILPVTGGFIRGFAQDSNHPIYVSLNAGPCYYRINSPSHGVNDSGWGITSNLTVGFSVTESISLEGRYEFMNEFGGFDFSAFTISAAVKLFETRL